MSIKVLVNGARGQLGKELNAISNGYPHLNLKFYSKEEWDICSDSESKRILALEAPAYLIQAAAYTKVDLAENNPALCFDINAHAPQKIAALCKYHNTRMFYLSSDYVFFNNGRVLIPEEAPKNPKGIYAQSKSLGEDLVLEANAESIVIRTSWLFSTYGHNFVKTMLRLCHTQNSIKVVGDQTGSPTYARHLAHALLKMITQTANYPLNNRVYHYSNLGTCTWHDFASEIFNYIKMKVELVKISTEDYGALAPRPAFSGLNCSRIQNQFQLAIKPWNEALHECLDRILPDLKECADEYK